MKHTATQVIDECTTCGCGRPWDDHGQGLPTKPKGRAAKGQLAIGTKVEKEHTQDPKKARQIAQDHLKENPTYYPTGRRPKGAKEALRYVKEGWPLFQVAKGRVKPFLLAERQWALSLGVDLTSPEFEALEGDTEAVRQLILQKLKAKQAEVRQKLLDAYVVSRYEDIIDEFEMAEAEEDALDYVLEMLYDWADEANVWVGLDTGEQRGHFSKEGTIEL